MRNRNHFKFTNNLFPIPLGISSVLEVLQIRVVQEGVGVPEELPDTETATGGTETTETTAHKQGDVPAGQEISYRGCAHRH